MFHFFHDLEAVPTAEQVLSVLYPKCGRVPPPERFVARAAAAIETAAPLLEPRGVTGEIHCIETDRDDALAGYELIVAGLVTIGPRLEEEAARREGVDRLLLDACGSAAVELLCDRVDAAITEQVARLGLKRTKRASPGYAPFLLKGQRALFTVLPARELGVELTEGLMMKPVKSISFFLRVGESPQLPLVEGKCRGCAIKNCRDRESAV